MPSAARPEPERETLLVLARYPERGRVKTRLARGIGEAAALACYRRMLDATLDLALQTAAKGRRVVVWVAPGARLDAFRRAYPGNLEWKPQREGDLGTRLAAAFGEAQSAGARRIVAIGSDCPGLDGERVDEAFAALSGAPAVLGPAEDGGYYLLGLSCTVPGIFQKIPWGGADVLARTVERIRAAGIRPVLLPVLRDVDEAADLAALSSAIPEGGHP